jgi:hypothetical protein
VVGFVQGTDVELQPLLLIKHRSSSVLLTATADPIMLGGHRELQSKPFLMRQKEAIVGVVQIHQA